MTFNDLPDGETIFLDANPLVYHYSAEPVLGPVCTKLMERIEKNQLTAYCSTHVLSEVAHNLMTIEAATLFSWPSKVVERLKQQPARIGQLQKFRQAVEKTLLLGMQVFSPPPALIVAATAVSQQWGLLSNDALIVAVMQAHGLTNIASNDSDFDRVPGITRYGPI